MSSPIVKTTTKQPIIKLPSRFFVAHTTRKNKNVKNSLQKFKNLTEKRGTKFTVVSSKTRPGSAGGARKSRRNRQK